MRSILIGALLGLLVALAVMAPLLATCWEFLDTGLWFPVYGVTSPPDWLYDMATKRGTI